METGPKFWAIHDNSYKNFHVKGFDYVCLQRTPMFTLKAYFFDEAHSDIVMPHNHRYDFTSTVLTGRLINKRYKQVSHDIAVLDKRPIVNEFEYMTPLNGGDGFKFVREIGLMERSSEIYKKGKTCRSEAQEIHTISVDAGTVLLLTQFEDQLPDNWPTQAFRFDSKEPPSLEGLYEQFKATELMKRLTQLKELGINTV